MPGRQCAGAARVGQVLAQAVARQAISRQDLFARQYAPIPGVDPRPAEQHGLHMFGVVQYIGLDRMADWSAFYGELFGFVELPAEQRFGVMTKGAILASPCGQFHWQLIEPEPDAADFAHDELLQRVAFGCTDVPVAVAAMTAASSAAATSRSSRRRTRLTSLNIRAVARRTVTKSGSSSSSSVIESRMRRVVARSSGSTGTQHRTVARVLDVDQRLAYG